MLTAALLLLSTIATDVSRSRSVEVPRSLDRTVLRLAVGLAATYGDEAKLPSVAELMEGDLGPAHISGVRLRVNHRRDGLAVVRVAVALATLAGFVLDTGSDSNAVELRYTLDYRGLAIDRRVTVTEGQIVSRAAFPCALGPQGRVKHVWFTATAHETPTGTTIRLTATVRVNTGLRVSRSRSRCEIVNRVAERAIRRQLDATLRQVEREGRSISASGHDALLAATRRFVDRMTRWTR